MNAIAQKQKNMPRARTRAAGFIIAASAAFTLLVLAAAAQAAYIALKHDRIHKGVSVEGMDASGLSKEELAGLLHEKFIDRIAGLEIALKAGDCSEKYTFSELGVEMDISSAVEIAFAIGRTGNIAYRLSRIFDAGQKGISIEAPIVYDCRKIEGILDSLHEKTLVKVKEPDLFIGEDKVTLRSGRSGRSIDKGAALSMIKNLIEARKGGTVEIPAIITPPIKLDVEDLYGRISLEAQDAAAEVKDNSVLIIPPVTGRSIDKSLLAEIVSELEKTEDTEKALPVKFITPELGVEDVKALLFRDTLSEASSQFYTYDENERNRAENIKIAVPLINGKILASGEVFSFNEIVGPRSEDSGYKTAHTYVGGKVIDGIGGGICQVSSTLYNAVLLADLKVIERRNHMFTVGYVPKGTDATVSYGSTDFRFMNSARWPIRIDGWVTKENKVFFSIKGTNETPGKTVEIMPSIVKTTPFETKYVDSPELPEGKTVIKQKGSNGYVVDTYKIIKQDGKVVSQAKIHTSVYRPLDREILRGTKKIPPAAPAPESPAPHATGVDDAGNPPAGPVITP